MISHSELLRLLDYDPASGLFRWKVRPSSRVKVGDIAGHVDQALGRRDIGVLGVRYYAYRLAWFYVHEEWPTAHIDHEDGNALNDRIGNLRLATRMQNQQNTKMFTTNTSGHRGVYWDKHRALWVAEINAGNKRHHLGRFQTAELAGTAYMEAKRQLHPATPVPTH